jgi:hypothetical protein
MLGISVHGLLGVDADLQRSAFAAHVVQQQQNGGVEYHSVRVLRHGDCDRYDADSARSRT